MDQMATQPTCLDDWTQRAVVNELSSTQRPTVVASGVMQQSTLWDQSCVNFITDEVTECSLIKLANDSTLG